MNDDEILIELSTIDGKSCDNCGMIFCGCKMVEIGSGIPDYLESLDAIVPLIKKHLNGINDFVEFSDYFNRTGLRTPGYYKLFTASPRELCVNFLKFIGRWKE